MAIYNFKNESIIDFFAILERFIESNYTEEYQSNFEVVNFSSNGKNVFGVKANPTDFMSLVADLNDDANFVELDRRILGAFLRPVYDENEGVFYWDAFRYNV